MIPVASTTPFSPKREKMIERHLIDAVCFLKLASKPLNNILIRILERQK